MICNYWQYMINECSWKGWLGWKRQYKGFWHRTHSAFNARTSIHAACDQETALQFKYCGGIEAEKISFVFLPLIMCPSNKTFGHLSKAIMTIFNWVNKNWSRPQINQHSTVVSWWNSFIVGGSRKPIILNNFWQLEWVFALENWDFSAYWK